jgi:Flp pilus assembly protein TadG
MKNSQLMLDRLTGRKGIIAVYVAILLVVIIGLAALAIDVGYMKVARNELQNAADAAALAGARKLGDNQIKSVNPVTTDVVSMSQDTANLNKVAGLNLSKVSGSGNIEVQIGQWDADTKTFVNAGSPLTAVNVTTKRITGTTDQGVGLFFGSIFNISSHNVQANACAALSGPCEEKPTIPLGMGKSWFTNDLANRGCKQIAINKTQSSCSGWTNLKDVPFKQKDVGDMLQLVKPIPTVKAGSYIEFGGGTVEPLVNDLDNLFRSTTYDVASKTFNADGTVKDWTVSVVVYDDSNICENPNERSMVIGFATIKITNVILLGNDKGLEGTVVCNIFQEGPGGCFYAGTYGTVPKLVK